MLMLAPGQLVSAANALVMDDDEGDAGATASVPREPQADAGTVHRLGYSAFYDVRSRMSSWPLPALTSCDALAAYAAAQDALLARDPLVGDLFLMYSARHGGFVRAGVVLDTQRVALDAAEWLACVVAEPAVVGFRRVLRVLSPGAGDRFIRWTALDPRLALAFSDGCVDNNIETRRAA